MDSHLWRLLYLFGALPDIFIVCLTLYYCKMLICNLVGNTYLANCFILFIWVNERPMRSLRHSPVRHPSSPLIYSTSIPICLPDPLPLVTVVITSSNETSEAVIGSSVSSVWGSCAFFRCSRSSYNSTSWSSSKSYRFRYLLLLFPFI